MSEWAHTALGEVLRDASRTERVASLSEVPWAGVRWYADGVYARAVDDAAIVKTKTLKRLRSGDITYNRMWATKAAFGVVGEEADGCLVTADFPVFASDPALIDERFIGLIFQSPRFQREAASRAVGTTERRRLKEADFLAIPIALPSLLEQRRIVDVMAAVDAQIDALDEEVARVGSVLDPAISEALDEMPATRPLGDLCTIRSGPSYTRTDVAGTAEPDTVPAIGIPNTKPDGSVDISTINHVRGLPNSVGRIDRSSLVLIRTNGNRQRIGNVYLPPSESEGCVVSAFQFLLKATADVDREYLYWVLRNPNMQEAMSSAASGTTGLGNLAAGWLKSAIVPWSDDRDARRAVVSRLSTLQTTVVAARTELGDLRVFRSTLLTSLLNQEIEIPASYDERVGAKL
ncbi:hypothetical protein BH09ACT11_BH09ACT11_12540 [soil metagenome]